jgi:exodeoxyribonuclease VIII
MLVDPQSCIDIGMEFDTSTILWWLGQSEEARLEMTKKCARYSIRDALLHLSAVVADVKNKTFGVSSTKPVYFWGNGATFDNVILGNAYHLCKIPPFWKYSKDMCYRTLRAMFHNFPYLKDDGVKHKAISDAIYQTNCFLKLMEIMHGVKKDGSE